MSIEEFNSLMDRCRVLDLLRDRRREVIERYSREDYVKINKYLRTGISDSEDVIKAQIEEIDSIFVDAPKSNGKLVVYRGLDYFIPEDGQKQLAYSSTSKKISEAEKFKSTNDCCLLQIHVESGMEYLDISSVSKFKEEEEIILPRNIYFIPIGLTEDYQIVKATRTAPLSHEEIIKRTEYVLSLILDEEREFITNIDDLVALFPSEDRFVLIEVFKRLS